MLVEQMSELAWITSRQAVWSRYAAANLTSLSLGIIDLDLKQRKTLV
jgi:hypothetical protein